MKPVSYKRVLAYLIDVFIVTIISYFLTMIIPATDEYIKASSDLTNVMESYQNGEIESEEYLEKVNDISYIINKESVSITIVTVVLTTVYFVVIAYYMNGQTLGKKLMKIKIVSTSPNKLTLNKLLVRSLIIDSILMNIISIVMILFMNKTTYLQIYDVISTIFGGVYVVTFAMMLFREDGRGLHDMIAKTKVILEENTKEVLETTNKDVKTAKTKNNKKEEIKEK